MALDAPLNGARVGSVFRVAGWAVDLAAMDGSSGIDTVHVWAYPAPGSGAAPIFLGVASYGIARPDVAAVYGDGTRDSGFELAVRGLATGQYLIVAFPHSTVTGGFTAPGTSLVMVAPDARIQVDGPAPSAAGITVPSTVVGWAVDAATQIETGIDAIHVWAFPTDGGAPIFAGVGDYGQARPDVAAAFGNSAYTNSGYSVTLRELPAGRYRLFVYARRTGMPFFDVAQGIAVEIVVPQASQPAVR